MIYNDLLRHIKTVEQARNLSSEIDLLIESLFKTPDGFEEALNSISAINAAGLREVFVKNQIDANVPRIKEYLVVLKEGIRKLKNIKFTIAFEPKESTIDSLFAWVSQNLKVGLILDVNVDKTILGGAIIEYEGKYEDLSLRKRMEEMFENKRQDILKTIE